MNRVINVVRMQLVNRQAYVWVPVIVLTGSLGLTLAIYSIIAGSGVQGPFYGGGAQAPLWCLLAVGVQALTLSFPFSQALSVTRKEFYLGTLLSAALTAMILAAIFVVGGLIERLTDGWGLNGYFFYLPWVWEHGPAAAALVFFALAFGFFVLGFWAATVYKRWGTVVLTAALVIPGLMLVAALWFIGRANAWVQVGRWFASQTAPGWALWGLLATAVLAGISYLILRRLVP